MPPRIPKLSPFALLPFKSPSSSRPHLSQTISESLRADYQSISHRRGIPSLPAGLCSRTVDLGHRIHTVCGRPRLAGHGWPSTQLSLSSKRLLLVTPSNLACGTRSTHYENRKEKAAYNSCNTPRKVEIIHALADSTATTRPSNIGDPSFLIHGASTHGLIPYDDIAP